MNPQYYRDEVLSPYAINLIKERYLWGDEKSPQDAFMRASRYAATYKGVTDEGHADRLYNYCSSLWFMYSTPVLSNGGTTRGYPISCYLSYVPDSREGLSSHYDENIWLASGGGGIGSYWGDVRSDGTSTSNGSKSTGCIPFMHVVDSQIIAFNQGTNRRGACATYMDIGHPEIEEFIDMRKTSGGDIHRKNLNLHHGVGITNEFLKRVRAGGDWRLVDPHSGNKSKTVKARDLWWKLIDTRSETGEPYIINLDNINDALHVNLKERGLKVHHSNLCTEITLPTSESRTAVCCLSSINAEKYDEWSECKEFIPDLVRALDNILDNFISEAGKSIGMAKAVHSATRERSLGLGVMGFHSLLQSKKVPIESAVAVGINRRLFAKIKEEAVLTTEQLARERGEAPDMAGSGRRNAHLMAVAPNSSSSIICGNTSPSIEPFISNVFTQKGVGGSVQVRNKYLSALIRSKQFAGMTQKNVDEFEEYTWQSIYEHDGSVQHVDCLTDYEKAVFKTAFEIDQRALVHLAIDRQEYIDQAQSLNLFFTPPRQDEPIKVHDDYLQYVSDVHLTAMDGLKTLYYMRSAAAAKTENIETKVPAKSDDCFYCEG